MKVKTKLIMGLVTSMVLLGGLGWFSSSNLTNLKQQFAMVEESVLPGTLAMKDIETKANEIYHSTLDYINTGADTARSTIDINLNRLDEIKKSYFEQSVTDPEKFEADLAMAAKIIDFNYSIEALLNMKEDGVAEEEILEQSRFVNLPALLELQHEVNERIQIYTEELAAIESSFMNTYESSKQGSILSNAFIFVLAIVGSILLTRSIVKPLQDLHKGTEMIARGNFDYKVGTKAKDEIGQLSRAFDQMTTSLSTSMTSIDRLNDEINEREKAEEALRFSDAAFKSIHESVIAVDNEFSITFWNEMSEKLFGVKSSEAIGKTPGEATDMIEDYPGQKEERLKTLIEQGYNADELLYNTPNGKIWVDTHAQAIEKDGERKGWMFLVADITERKKMERQLQKQMQELKSANDKLRELDKMKDAFLSTVSHELRTPLTSIKSFAEILLTYDEDKETQREFLTIINDESDRLTKLINDFLDLSKIESGRMQWETVELSLVPIIIQAINITQSLVKEKDLTVEFSEPAELPAVCTDKDRTIQVVTNILSNAIKFTPEKGTINLEVKVGKNGQSGENKDMVVVSVTDSGIGIALEDQAAVFEKFKQVGDTLTDKPTGTGLGLPICKEIIEHYGGKIWVESELGKGSTFLFSLPVKQGEQVIPEEPCVGDESEILELETEVVETIKKNDRKKLLVVDDEENIRRFLSHEFKKKDYKVYEAANGNEALELARRHHPDLITLDIQMPDLNGFDVTSVLKSDSQTKDIPILIVSVIEDKDKAFRLGVNDYVTKPFNFDELVGKVDYLIKNSNKNILVVDDDRSLVRSVKYHLERKGYSVSVAHDGDQALKKVARRQPDLILLDIMMPNVDGYQVLKELKSNPDTDGIRIVLMTGIEIDGGRVKALSIGATDYITKSNDFDRLYDMVDNILVNGIGAEK